jgi:hypothetical protein
VVPRVCALQSQHGAQDVNSVYCFSPEHRKLLASKVFTPHRRREVVHLLFFARPHIARCAATTPLEQPYPRMQIDDTGYCSLLLRRPMLQTAKLLNEAVVR